MEAYKFLSFVGDWLQDNMALEPRCIHIDYPLVAAAAKGKGEIPLLLVKGSIDKNIGCFQQCVYSRFLACLQLFKRIACIDPDIQCFCMKPLGESRQWLRLAERLAAAEGHTGQNWIFCYLPVQGINVRHASAVKRMCLRVMTAWAMMRTALRENRETIAIAIDDGIIDDTRNADFS